MNYKNVAYVIRHDFVCHPSRFFTDLSTEKEKLFTKPYVIHHDFKEKRMSYVTISLNICDKLKITPKK